MRTSQVSFTFDRKASKYRRPMSTPISRRTSSDLSRSPTSSSVHVSANDVEREYKMSAPEPTERTRLLAPDSGRDKIYAATTTSTPRSRLHSQINSLANSQTLRKHGSRWSLNNFDAASSIFPRSGLRTPRVHRPLIINNVVMDNRTWYDQFTSTDWVQDSIADGYRALELKKRKGLRARLWVIFDAAQGWILMAIIGCLTAYVAYAIDVSEAAIYDLKRGYCRDAWYLNQSRCCQSKEQCEKWHSWSELLSSNQTAPVIIEYLGFVLGCIVFATIACLLTLLSKTVIPSHIASTLDENLAAERLDKDRTRDTQSTVIDHSAEPSTAMTFYSAAGSGVAEVKVILSGFVLHGYLGLKTLFLKCPALILSVASGMSLGKEGPYVHIATCIGNVACRLFSKYNLNDGKRREVLSAAAASGVAVAFGSPLGGVLFSLEEVSYYFPPKTLFRTFFCCIAAALSLKFLDPYGTKKIVIFEVRYDTDWHVYELLSFALLGVLGGLAGAGFIKASRVWAKTFRRYNIIKSNPLLEVLLVALLTGSISFWNRYANLSVGELLLELASPCGPDNTTGLCPGSKDDIPAIIGYLSIAFLIKAFLTIITFGIKVPAGIYVPSMVCGGLMGRIVGHSVQYAVMSFSGSGVIGHCPVKGDMEHCITPGVYALVAAGATMCGVTRLSVTLAVILFELTGSLNHVLPFAIGVLTAKWTADLVEPYSIYDLLIDMNSYPFMDNRHVPLFDKEVELGDLTSRVRRDRIIDISISSYVRASDLRIKLNVLQNAGEFDGGLPIICNKALVGFVPAPDLEFALDRIDGPEEETLCLLSYTDQLDRVTNHRRWFPMLGRDNEDNEMEESITSSRSSILDGDERHGRDVPEADLVPFVDPAPVALEVHSPMNLVYQLFSKLGLRYVCVVEAGEYRGMVHKKLFVKYLETCETKHE